MVLSVCASVYVCMCYQSDGLIVLDVYKSDYIQHVQYKWCMWLGWLLAGFDGDSLSAKYDFGLLF